MDQPVVKTPGQGRPAGSAGQARRLIAGLIAGLGIALALAAPALADSQHAFKVLLGDKEIGSHNFIITDTAAGFTMTTEARFKVKIAFVTVFSYRHNNRETWADGCLVSMDSTTTDGGDDFSVKARRGAEGTRVESATEGTATHSGCVMSFSYWKQDYLQQAQLLNSQNGAYMDVDISNKGPASMTLDGSTTPVVAWGIRSGDLIDITVWYHRDTGRWLGLRSLRDGRVINYKPADYREVTLPAL